MYLSLNGCEIKLHTYINNYVCVYMSEAPNEYIFKICFILLDNHVSMHLGTFYHGIGLIKFEMSVLIFLASW